ncbi:hypothetical protein HY571_01170 [Candidatus Micrarchaeota archaeon]|nr:hypothetical protein [Candidatus Micrarchaeota archaeon]
MNTFSTLEEMQNYLRKQSGKITGREFQPALQIVKKEFEKNIEINQEQKTAFDMLFEKLEYKENGKPKHPGVAVLLVASEFQKIETTLLNRIETLCKALSKELTQRTWEYSELFLHPLQRINNACRDIKSFLNPRIADTYEFEIRQSTLPEHEKKALLEFMKKTTE